MTDLLAVRTVTCFIVLGTSTDAWPALLSEAVAFVGQVANDLRADGFTVQTLRLITNPFGEYLDTVNPEAALQGLEKIKQILHAIETQEKVLLSGTRIRFSIGAADAKTLSLVPTLIRSGGDLANCCINVPADTNGVVDSELVHEAAKVVTELGATTDRGEGNFNFTINFNGPTKCPYFPAGCHFEEEEKTFVIGLEYPNLLVDVLKKLAGDRSSVITNPSTKNAEWKNAADAMRLSIEHHVRKIVEICRCAENSSSSSSNSSSSSSNSSSSIPVFKFGGIDSSPAPSKSAESMCRVVELLGVEHFGASGTTECCALLTRVFKSICQNEVDPVPLVGFSGIMFAALEDKGLAEAAAMGYYDIRNLLTYSAVCGIGLDTVPIPFETSSNAIARLAQDVGTMAYRLNKPLTIRLFPVPGLTAGEMTAFESEDLCNCTVFKVP